MLSEKSPKKYRYSFLTKIHNLLFDIIELLYETNSIQLGNEERIEKQRLAKVKLEILDYLCDLGIKKEILEENHKYKHLGEVEKSIE